MDFTDLAGVGQRAGAVEGLHCTGDERVAHAFVFARRVITRLAFLAVVTLISDQGHRHTYAVLIFITDTDASY